MTRTRNWIALLLSLSLVAAGRAQAPLRWGGDKAGGAPFIFEEEGKGTVGFEWEIANYLAAAIGRTSEFVQVDWDNLPDTLERGNIDVALNGMEYRTEWEPRYPSTIPYFIFSLRLIVRSDDASVRSWEDLRVADGMPKKRIGVLRGSLAERYLEKTFGNAIVIVPTREVDETFQLVEGGKRLDATVQDSPAALYYVMSGRLPKLRVVGEPVAKGYYVLLTPRGEAGDKFRAQLNEAIRKGFASGRFEEIMRRYGLWDIDQERLAYVHLRPWPPIPGGPGLPGLPGGVVLDEKETPVATPKRTLGGIQDKILKATWMTIALAFSSMPIALLLGVLIACGRLYGPALLRLPLTAYVEVIRGTPILLQMFVWFFLVPQLAKMSGWEPLVALVSVDPFVVGVFALAVNYSAYEAEIFRAGLQSIPKGQMEAALALGMSPFTAIRRIILPQAVRVVIPPVTNDFIALFKDTSVCSMILITELTGLYYQNKGDRDLMLQLALVIGLIYFLLSYPLSLLSRRLETQLKR